MTKVINFYAGPSAGKTTMAAQLFGWMKAERMNVEYVPEFAKTLTWQGSSSLDDQMYVLGNQHHAMYTLRGQVDYIITDSPILIQLHYMDIGFSKFVPEEDDMGLREVFREVLLLTYLQYDNVNFYVERGDRKFIQAGRNQDEATARVYDDAIHKVLVDNWIEFKRVNTLDQVIDTLKLKGEPDA